MSEDGEREVETKKEEVIGQKREAEERE